MFIEDFDLRSGSATSLLRTVIGSQLRRVGGWISVAHLISLMDALEISEASTRSAVLRVKNKGLILAESQAGQAGYRLNPESLAMLERADHRIFSFRHQRDNGRWCLISFSMPESQRDVRHQLRRRLSWIGCGTVATGLWICPAWLTDEVEEILESLNSRDAASLFIAETPRLSSTFAEAAARWWDLNTLEKLHRSFLNSHADTATVTDRDAFSCYMRVLDDWRSIPFLDPGLPRAALPPDWPGFDSATLFGRLVDGLARPAAGYVRSVVAD